MAHFILLHGFNDPSAGKENIDKAAPRLIAMGHTVDCDGQDYGYFNLFMVRFRRHKVIARIVKAIREAEFKGQDVVVVGYSNGCNYALQALGFFFLTQVKLILVHPALPAKFKLPESVSRCWVCYTRSDWTVRLASYVRWLIPGWGRAGAIGYKGEDPRVVNVNYSNVAVKHGGLWKDGPLALFAEDLDRYARS